MIINLASSNPCKTSCSWSIDWLIDYFRFSPRGNQQYQPWSHDAESARMFLFLFCSELTDWRATATFFLTLSAGEASRLPYYLGSLVHSLAIDPFWLRIFLLTPCNMRDLQFVWPYSSRTPDFFLMDPGCGNNHGCSWFFNYSTYGV